MPEMSRKSNIQAGNAGRINFPNDFPRARRTVPAQNVGIKNTRAVSAGGTPSGGAPSGGSPSGGASSGVLPKSGVNIKKQLFSGKPRSRRKAAEREHHRERLSKFDYPFFILVMVLMVFGVVMMFSASYAFAYRTENDSYFYITRQLYFIAVGVAAMIFLSFVNYRVMLKKYILYIGLAVSTALMIWVKLGGGVEQGGAERWLEIGGTMFQPSEIAKFAVIMTFAYMAHKRVDVIKTLKQGFMPFAVCLAAFCGLMIAQPHLSGMIIIFLIGLVMMFVGGCRVKHIVAFMIILAIIASVLLPLMQMAGYDYFGNRIQSWLQPESDKTGVTMQTYQSLVTIGSGGVFGLGLGNSRQKYSFLPASHNDFIFSIICEELGFVGAMVIILLFVLFIFRGFYIASKARDRFGMLLAVGITAQIGIQALLNIAVVTNSIPNTGISLPFFSYGGTALLMQLAEIGVVLNISRKAAT